MATFHDVEARIKAAEAKRKPKYTPVSISLSDHIAPVYYPLHEDVLSGKHTFYNLPGGRGSCKSSFVSLEIVSGIMADQSGESSAIVFRLVAGTMRESVYAQIAWAIDVLDVNHLWRGTVSPMRWEFIPTGAQIIFRGLDDSSKLKSIKPTKGRFKYIWFEEFSELPGENTMRSVLQSVMRGGETFTVFRSFNPPISKANWANVYIAQPDERSITLHTDYRQIPADWLGDAFILEAERLQTINEQAYRHEYLGEAIGSGGDVFPNLEIRTITDEEIDMMENIYHGLDFGFAVDPACFIRVAYDRKHETVYLLDEIYVRKCSNKALAEKIRAKNYPERLAYSPLFHETYKEELRITCDCAEPKSIADMNELGFKASPCHKRPGCVEYRVKWLQHRKIVIDPKRTPEAHREFVNYEYATDKDGNFLSILPDKDNHAIDATAYALNRPIFMKEGGTA